VIALAACTPAATGGGGSSGGGGGFRVFYPDAKAKIGKHYQVKPAAECKRDDGSDARWTSGAARVESGALPPGVEIEDGALNGAPTKAGTYNARIAVTGVTCAGKAMDDQHVDVTITVR
jgi:hypothetical protein